MSRTSSRPKVIASAASPVRRDIGSRNIIPGAAISGVDGFQDRIEALRQLIRFRQVEAQTAGTNLGLCPRQALPIAEG